MASVVSDTHAAVWYFHGDPRLSRVAAKAFEEASALGDPILLPSICLVELTYLVEKGRIPKDVRERLIRVLNAPDGPMELAPLDASVAAAVERIDRLAVPDLPDRVIAATALARQLPLVTCDEKIRASTVLTIW
jgi:PIN domain nuclease of toxin-antitoxin system